MVSMRKRGDPRGPEARPASDGTPPATPPTASRGGAAPAGAPSAGRSGDLELIRQGNDNARRITETMLRGAASLAALDAEYSEASNVHQQRVDAIPVEPSELIHARHAFESVMQKAVQVRQRHAIVLQARSGRHEPIALSTACRHVRDKANAIGNTASVVGRLGVKQRLTELGVAIEVLEESWAADQDQRYTAELERARKVFDGIERRVEQVQDALGADVSSCLSAWGRTDSDGARAHPLWTDPAWRRFEMPTVMPQAVRIGTHLVTTPIGSAQQPALWTFPAGQSLLVSPAPEDFTRACPALLSIVLRVVASMPRGSFQVKFFDPAGLGNNVAPLMQLREYDEALVDATVAVNESDVTTSLEELISHVGHVNASYLKGKFATIEDHNEAAGEVAVPYRIAAVFGYPQNFSERAIAALCDLAESGAKAGVFVVALEQTGRGLPYGADDSRLRHAARAVRILPIPTYGPDGRASGQRPMLADTVPDPRGIAFQFDPPIEFRIGDTATDTVFGRIVDSAGAAARESRVRVVEIAELWSKFRDAVHRNPALYDGVPPSPLLDDPTTWWQAKSTRGVDVPLGRVGATKFQRYSVTKHQHAHTMIIGGTGTGKSTLLHGMVAAICATYSPDEVELTLVDMKDGVGFNIYASELLPHARTIAVKSDRAVALEVLSALVGEMHRRNEMFGEETRRTATSVTDIAEYRASSGAVLPRHFCIIDEFHDLTGLDDQIGSAARQHIRTIAKEGRSAGIHLVLSSQNAVGAGLGPEILSEIAVRICFRVGSSSASEAALGDGNTAAVEDLPAGEAGVAIYNVDRQRSGNEIFKVALIGKESEVPRLVRQLADRARTGPAREAPRIFDGTHSADLAANRDVLDLFGLVPTPTVRSTATGTAPRAEVVASLGRRPTTPPAEPAIVSTMGRRRRTPPADVPSSPSTDPSEAADTPSDGAPAGFGEVRRDATGSFEVDVDDLMFIPGVDSPRTSAPPVGDPTPGSRRPGAPVARSPKGGQRPARTVPGFLGQPLSFATSLSVQLDRGSGGHLLYVGGSEPEVLGAFTGVAIGALSVCRGLLTDRAPVVTVLDQEVSDTATDYWQGLARWSDGLIRYVDSLQSEQVVDDIVLEIDERQRRRRDEVPLPHLVLLYGGEQAQFLRATDSSWDATAPAFDRIVSSGPAAGVHVAARFEGRRGVTSVLGSGRTDAFGHRVASHISVDDRGLLLDDHTIKGLPTDRPVLRNDRGALAAFIPFEPLTDDAFVRSVVGRCLDG